MPEGTKSWRPSGTHHLAPDLQHLSVLRDEDAGTEKPRVSLPFLLSDRVIIVLPAPEKNIPGGAAGWGV